MRSWISVFILQRDEKLAISQGSIFVGWASSYTKLKEWLSGVCVTKMFSGQRKGKTILKTQHLIVEVPPSVSRWQVLPIAWFQLQWDNNRDGACKKGGVDNAKQIVMMGGCQNFIGRSIYTWSRQDTAFNLCKLSTNWNSRRTEHWVCIILVAF